MSPAKEARPSFVNKIKKELWMQLISTCLAFVKPWVQSPVPQKQTNEQKKAMGGLCPAPREAETEIP
jgi:hypothetical protein